LGEASSPGPSKPETFKFAITNPTSIYSKAQVYKELQVTHGLDVITASETSATQLAQQGFATAMRPAFRKMLWSVPVQDHRPKTDGTASKRGKAAGVACMSSQRIRMALGTLSSE